MLFPPDMDVAGRPGSAFLAGVVVDFYGEDDSRAGERILQHRA